MQTYKNLGGNSSVTGYEPIPGGIHVQFKHSAVYEYRAENLGDEVVRQMVALAERGQGLGSYINRTPSVYRGGHRVM